MGGRWYAPDKSGSTILCAAKADRARRWGGSPHTHSCEAEPAGRVEPSGRGGGGPGKPRAAVRGDMWRGHGGGDGAVLGARSAHFSAEKGVMSGICGPSSSRTVAPSDSEHRGRPCANPQKPRSILPSQYISNHKIGPPPSTQCTRISSSSRSGRAKQARPARASHVAIAPLAPLPGACACAYASGPQ